MQSQVPSLEFLLGSITVSTDFNFRETTSPECWPERNVWQWSPATFRRQACRLQLSVVFFSWKRSALFTCSAMSLHLKDVIFILRTRYFMDLNCNQNHKVQCTRPLRPIFPCRKLILIANKRTLGHSVLHQGFSIHFDTFLKVWPGLRQH